MSYNYNYYLTALGSLDLNHFRGLKEIVETCMIEPINLTINKKNLINYVVFLVLFFKLCRQYRTIVVLWSMQYNCK